MTVTHDTGSYNVESTLAAWLYVQLLAYKPDLVTAVSMAREFPEKPIQCPMWSVHFLGSEGEGGEFEGGHVETGKHGRMMFGIMEVGCWVSRGKSNTSWQAQKAQMSDAVTKGLNNLYSSGAALLIKDFYTSASTPADTAYKVTIDRWAKRPPPDDPNPDLERERILIYYHWVERV